MPLIVAPDVGYDSLVSLTDAADYMAKFGHAWPAEAADQEVALRKGTQYLLGAYAIKPAYLNPVDQRVKDACCEAALRAVSGELFRDVQAQAIVQQTVDVISTTYSQPQNGGQIRFAVIDALLRGLVDGGIGQIKLVRG